MPGGGGWRNRHNQSCGATCKERGLGDPVQMDPGSCSATSQPRAVVGIISGIWCHGAIGVNGPHLETNPGGMARMRCSKLSQKPSFTSASSFSHGACATTCLRRKCLLRMVLKRSLGEDASVVTFACRSRSAWIHDSTPNCPASFADEVYAVKFTICLVTDPRMQDSCTPATMTPRLWSAMSKCSILAVCAKPSS